MLVPAFLVAAAILPGQGPALLDVSTLKIGPSQTVTVLDLGRLKGELRQLAWSSDKAMLYVQTGEGDPPGERLWHYTVRTEDGAVTPVSAEPDWALAYWATKQDRTAPGLPSLVIEVDQHRETVKLGMGGGAGALDRTGSPESSSGSISAGDGQGSQNAVVRLALLGQVVGAWTNERVIPGTRFGWGPKGSGAISFVDEAGRLVLFDQQKRMQVVADVKDARLPAWSTDGSRLAFLMKAGRKKYTLAWVPLDR